MSDKTAMYLIWSYEHNAWWRPARNGYTTNVSEAGEYTYDEVASIVINHVPPGEEVAVYNGNNWGRLTYPLGLTHRGG